MAVRTFLKLSAPEQPFQLSRERLRAPLCAEILRNRVTLMCAGAGWGKTTALRDLVNNVDATVGWYQLDRTDRHLSQFIGYIIDMMRQYIPEFSVPLSGVGEFDNVADINPEEVCHYLALQVAQELSRTVETHFIIVLDNYEQVDSGESVNLFLRSLIQFLPHHLHLVIASRERPHLPWPRLLAGQVVFEIGQADLAFTAEETYRLCCRLLDGPPAESTVNMLQDKTEGWPAGIVMAVRGLRGLPPEEIDGQLRNLSGTTPVIREYFEEEVFSGCSPETQSFLMRTSILSVLDRDICDELVPIGPTRETLARLSRSGTFVRPSTRIDSYSYQPLFREFLMDRLRRLVSTDSASDLYLRAARALERTGDIEEARRFYMEAGAFDPAADLLERVADDFLERYMLDIVKTWMSAIPERVRAGRPWLLAFHGKTMRRLGNPNVALPILEVAWKLFSDRGDGFGMAYVASETGFTYANMGQVRKGLEVLEATLERIGADHGLRARLFIALCLTHQRLDALDEAEQYGNLVLYELGEVPLHPAQRMLESRARQYLAHVHARRGNLHAALDECDRALALCEEENLGEFKRSWALHTRALILALQGANQAALEALQAADECGDRDNRLQSRAIHHVRGNIYRDMGEFALAHECYQHCHDSSLADQALLCLREGRLAAAEDLVQAACRFYAARDSVVDRAIGEVTAALVAEAQGQLDGVPRHLEEAGVFSSNKKPNSSSPASTCNLRVGTLLTWARQLRDIFVSRSILPIDTTCSISCGATPPPSVR